VIKQQRIRLNESSTPNHVRLLSETVFLSEGIQKSWVTLTRSGHFHHPKFGQFDHNRQLFESFIKNFKGNIYGQDVAIDVEHKPSNGAAGYIKDLRIDGRKLRAFVEWTPYGIDAV